MGRGTAGGAGAALTQAAAERAFRSGHALGSLAAAPDMSAFDCRRGGRMREGGVEGLDVLTLSAPA